MRGPLGARERLHKRAFGFLVRRTTFARFQEFAKHHQHLRRGHYAIRLFLRGSHSYPCAQECCYQQTTHHFFHRDFHRDDLLGQRDGKLLTRTNTGETYTDAPGPNPRARGEYTKAAVEVKRLATPPTSASAVSELEPSIFLCYSATFLTLLLPLPPYPC